MADCEVCGASDANTRRVRMHGALLDACSACQSRLGLTIDEIKDANKIREQFQQSAQSGRRRGDTRRSQHGMDMLSEADVELANDFAARIKKGRELKGWDQRTLALRMKERINEVKRAESGHRPSDKVLLKFEKSLDIVLMEAVDGRHERHVDNSGPRTLNLGDLLDAAKRDRD